MTTAVSLTAYQRLSMVTLLRAIEHVAEDLRASGDAARADRLRRHTDGLFAFMNAATVLPVHEGWPASVSLVREHSNGAIAWISGHPDGLEYSTWPPPAGVAHGQNVVAAEDLEQAKTMANRRAHPEGCGAGCTEWVRPLDGPNPMA